jgi:hypothetical protein
MDLLHKERWSVGVRLMKRLWRRESLLVPQKRVKRLASLACAAEPPRTQGATTMHQLS